MQTDNEITKEDAIKTPQENTGSEKVNIISNHVASVDSASTAQTVASTAPPVTTTAQTVASAAQTVASAANATKDILASSDKDDVEGDSDIASVKIAKVRSQLYLFVYEKSRPVGFLIF